MEMCDGKPSADARLTKSLKNPVCLVFNTQRVCSRACSVLLAVGCCQGEGSAYTGVVVPATGFYAVAVYGTIQIFLT